MTTLAQLHDCHSCNDERSIVQKKTVSLQTFNANLNAATNLDDVIHALNCLETQLVTRSIIIQRFRKTTHSSVANLESVATFPKRFIIATDARANVIRKCEKAVHHISWIQSGGFGFAS